jgi:hypothetical protein
VNNLQDDGDIDVALQTSIAPGAATEENDLQLVVSICEPGHPSRRSQAPAWPTAASFQFEEAEMGFRRHGRNMAATTGNRNLSARTSHILKELSFPPAPSGGKGRALWPQRTAEQVEKPKAPQL